jgi:hypothetical protein
MAVHTCNFKTDISEFFIRKQVKQCLLNILEERSLMTPILHAFIKDPHSAIKWSIHI